MEEGLDRTEGSPERTRYEGWLFIADEAVPEKWRGRAVGMSLVPLLPGEMAEFVGDQSADGFIPDERDVALYKLVARGLSANDIARELGIASRSVHRRLARLRERLEVETTSQLAAEFARRGF
jgi:DNA-binding CsgD family transcriptional regulator